MTGTRKAAFVHLLSGIAHGGIASASGRRIAYDGDDFGARIVRNEANPFIAFAEGDPDDEDAGKKRDEDKKADKRFTEADVERIVKDRLKKMTREHEALKADKEKRDEEFRALSERLEELESKGGDEDGGKDQAKEIAKLQRELKKATDQVGLLTKERDLAAKSLAETSERYTRTRVDGLLRDGLISSKAHKDGLADAVELMRMRGQATLDEDGKLSITIGGVPYDDAKDAAAAFLKAHPYLAEGMPGAGDGTPRPNGGGSVVTEKQMETMGVGGLLAAGLRQPVK